MRRWPEGCLRSRGLLVLLPCHSCHANDCQLLNLSIHSRPATISVVPVLSLKNETRGTQLADSIACVTGSLRSIGHGRSFRVDRVCEAMAAIVFSMER